MEHCFRMGSIFNNNFIFRIFQESYCCRIASSPDEDKLIWYGGNYLPKIKLNVGKYSFFVRKGLRTDPFGRERIAFCLEFQRKGLDLTFPIDIAEMISGILLSGSNRKPLIFFPVLDFPMPRASLSRVPCLLNLPWFVSHPHYPLVISS